MGLAISKEFMEFAASVTVNPSKEMMRANKLRSLTSSSIIRIFPLIILVYKN